MRLRLVFGLALVLVAGTRGQAGDEPVMGGKTAGQWIAIFQDKNRSWAERQQAVETIGYLGPGGKGAVPSLIQALVEPKTGNEEVDAINDWLRYYVVEALGRIGPSAVEANPKLFPKTGDGRLLALRTWEWLDTGMSRALGRIGRPAVPALIKALQGEDPELRIFALWTLGEIEGEAEAAVPALIAALDDPSIGPSAMGALVRIGPAAAPAIPALEAKLKRGELGSADFTGALQRIGKAGVPLLVQSFQQEARSYVRPDEDSGPGVEAFLQLGTEAREAAPALVPYLTDKRPMIRAAAAVALGAVAPDTPGVVPALIEILKYPSPDPATDKGGTPEQLTKKEFGLEAALVLGWIGPPARSALPALLENLKEQEADEASFWNKDWPPVPGLIGIMIRIDPGSKLVVPPLLRAIRQGDRTAMLDATMFEPIPKIVLKALTRAAYDENVDVGNISMVAHRLGSAAAPAVPAVIDSLDDEEFGGSAAEALGAIGPAAKEAVPALERKLRSKEGPWLWTTIALLQIDPSNRAAKEYLAKKNHTMSFESRAILAGTLGKWSPEGEALTRERLLRMSKRNIFSSYDWYSPGLCDPYCGIFELSHYGPGARVAVPVLTKLLTFRDRFVRRWAADALRRIDGVARALLPGEKVTQPVH
jgi:HEAT repeat protein